MIGGVGYAMNMIGLRLNEPYWLFIIYASVSVVVVPFALAYAILRHRAFDVALVLNRTIVFALTSAIVLIVSAALEFGAERFLSEGIILQFAIALSVIISVRLLHRKVDLVVDNVLFRSRLEHEKALKRFASTLQFYTEEQPLARATIEVLSRYGRVQGSAVYDMAYVEIRAHHEPLLVHALPAAFPGDRLYPMVRAGRVAGVIATGEPIEDDQIRLELATLRTRLGFS
jgi:hypothetical protein